VKTYAYLVGLLVAAGVGWFINLPALGASASSANYTLEKHSFTSGNPMGPTVPSSTNYRLAASNLGDLSGPSISAAGRMMFPGYLMPWDALTGRPNLLGFIFAHGRIWLNWERGAGAGTYTVEHASHPDHFTPLVTGITTNHWDMTPSTATSRMYRVMMIPQP
jgi:hypothetical protein